MYQAKTKKSPTVKGEGINIVIKTDNSDKRHWV